MLNGKRILALIPARGGSKRLPGKNTKLINGKPLIAWTIEAAKNSKYIDTVVVSTEDNTIAKISANCGATIPFIRPKELATDNASTKSVIEHCLNHLKSAEDNYDVFILLQPTSPLREEKHIDEALELFFAKEANFVLSVCECEHSPLWSNTLPKDQSLDQFIAKEANKRGQELPVYHRLNGAICICNISAYLETDGDTYSADSFAYIMGAHSSVDIDNEIDFLLAETLFQHRSK